MRLEASRKTGKKCVWGHVLGGLMVNQIWECGRGGALDESDF